ncbi:hypothetical protein QCA50_005671 [Cerrena zonata]|uniref:Alpha/beta hydrolase fold-3 domain-containing protein n=1 Tax=Cerrena zonata TaxID=2478898 RepID=A0AAW0GJZ5_9APHY
MADWTEYSKPEDDLAPLIGKLPKMVFTLEMLPIIRSQMEQSTKMIQEAQKHLLPGEDEYRIQDYQVPVENGEILVRCIIPTPAGNADKTFPLYVWYHGGGWIFGTIHMNDYQLRRLAVDLQITVVNVDYRLAPEHPFPIPLKDSYAALKWAVEHVSLLSVSLDKGFIVGGQSAGANLAAVLTHWARDDSFFDGRKLTGQLLQIPAVLHPHMKPKQYGHLIRSLEQNKDAPILSTASCYALIDLYGGTPEDPDCSVLLAPSHRDLPPAVFQVAGGDPLRDSGLVYEMILKEAGVKTKLNIYPGMPHGGFGVLPGVRVYQQWDIDYPEGLNWLLSSV